MGDRVSRPLIKDNRGFTLVELLVAVALVALVGSAVFGFMTVGSKTFTKNSSEVNLQSESQLAYNQMQDLIIDTAIGIDYGYVPEGSSFDLQDYHSYAGTWSVDDTLWPACASKKLVMYNLNRVYELTWIKDESKLYYTEYEAHRNGSDEVERDGLLVEPSLMADYITEFHADLSLMPTKRIVRIDTTYEKNGNEYISSHNITLRNRPLSGNKVPAYIELPVDDEPRELIGDPDIYIKPGETINLREHPIVNAPGEEIKDENGVVIATDTTGDTYKGYIIRYDPFDDKGNSDPADDTGHDFPGGPQDIRFSIKSGQTGCYSSIDPDSGVLTVDSRQSEAFEVTVTGTYGIYTVVKKVKIHVLRVDGIEMSFTPGAPSVSQNGLKTAEEFTITAKVRGVEDKFLGARITNETSDVSHTGIDYSVAWTIGKGAAQFDRVSGSETGPDSSYESTCSFKMKEVSATDVALQVVATSNESTALAYKNSAGVVTPVIGSIDLKTYKDPEDPSKKFRTDDNGGDYERGLQYVVNLKEVSSKDSQNTMEESLSMEDGSLLDLKGLIKVIDIHVYEQEYVLDDDGNTAVPKSEFVEITDDCFSNEEILIDQGGAANWRFCAPMWYNPNSKYRYVIQHKLVKNPDPSKADSYDYRWYTKSDAQALYNSYGFGDIETGRDDSGNTYIRAVGSKVDVTFDRLKYEYIRDSGNAATPVNFHTFGKNKSQTAVYYPRSFNEAAPSKEFWLEYTYDKSFQQAGAYTERDGFHWATFDFYKKTGGKYSYGNKTSDDASVSSHCSVNENFLKITDNGSKGTNNIFNIEVPRSKIRFEGFVNGKNEWKNIEPEFRIVPVVKIDHGTRYDGNYILLDSYIDVKNWNINIPGDGIIARLLQKTGVDTSERTYFPLPSDYNFPGAVGKMETQNAIEIWTGGKEWANPCCNYTLFSHPTLMYYTLEKHNYGSSESAWWELTLFVKRETGTKNFTAFERYTCEQDGTEWVIDSSFKTSHTDAELPILNL